MLAGRLASDSVPPRLTASLKICSAFRNLNARGLAADNIERKSGACTKALPREHTSGGRGFVVMSEVVNPLHLVVVAQIIRHEPRILVGLFHPQAQRFERAAEHPAGMRIQLGADRASQRLDVFHEGL